MTEPQLRCDLYENGGKDDCGGPLFSDPQPEGVDLKVCAFHTLMNRNEWMNEAEKARARIAALESEVAQCLGHKTKIALTLKVAELEDWVTHVQNAHADECASCDDRARRYFTALQGHEK